MRCKHVGRAIFWWGWVAVAGSAFAQSSVQAHCPDPVFACQIAQSHKQVQLCLHGERLHYRFGAPGAKPELQFSQRLHYAEFTPWNGMGERYWSSVQVRNGAWGYAMTVSYLRGAEDAQAQAHIQVLLRGEIKRQLTCDTTTLQERIEAVMPQLPADS